LFDIFWLRAYVADCASPSLPDTCSSSACRKEAFAVLLTTPAVDGVSDAVTAVLGERPADLPDIVLLGNTETLLTLRSQLDAAVADNLAVINAREATVDDCGRSTGGWLREEMLLDPGAAARKLRVARQKDKWPATEAAWRAGDLSEDHVDVIFKALGMVPAEAVEIVEQALIEIARCSPPRDVAAALDQILLHCGVDDADSLAARRHATRGVTVAKTFGGTGSLAGTLSAVLADKLTRALEHAGAPAGPEDDRTRAQRFHDALETMTDHFLDTADMPRDDNGERAARVVVTIPLEALESRLTDAWGLLPSGAQIGPETARRLSCDAEVIPVVLGGRSVLDIGLGRRTFAAHVRRAAIARDGDRCVFPSCANARIECHHIRHWAHGGASDLDNAAWLCAFHHYLVHERGWALRREPDGGYTFTSPTGRIRTSSKIPDPDPPWD
jgi:hypothetical protein